MITDAQVEKALEWLRDNAEEAAAARANRIAVEEFRKVKKAELMKLHAELPLGAQEREAYAHHEYREHLDAIREAVRLDERFRFLRETALARIEAWRSQSANQRANV